MTEPSKIDTLFGILYSKATLSYVFFTTNVISFGYINSGVICITATIQHKLPVFIGQEKALRAALGFFFSFQIFQSRHQNHLTSQSNTTQPSLFQLIQQCHKYLLSDRYMAKRKLSIKKMSISLATLDRDFMQFPLQTLGLLKFQA